MGFNGVWSMSQLLGLLMALPDDESGGVEGEYSPSASLSSVSSTIVGLSAMGMGDARGVRVDDIMGKLLKPLGRSGGCEHDELGREYTGVEGRGATIGSMGICWNTECCWCCCGRKRPCCRLSGFGSGL
jgi:hypothetical protein